MRSTGRLLILGDPAEARVAAVVRKLKREEPIIVNWNTKTPRLEPLNYRVSAAKPPEFAYCGVPLPGSIQTVWMPQAANESHPVSKALLTAFPHARWVSPPAAVADATRVPHHLEMARRAGFTIASKMGTPNPDEAMGFIREVGPCMVMGHGVSLVLVHPETMEDDFPHENRNFELQQWEPELHGVHVTVVGEKVFSVSVTVPTVGSDARPVDWRHAFRIATRNATRNPSAATDNLCYIDSFMLGFALVHRCVKLIRMLGLAAGVIEFSNRGTVGRPQLVLLRVSPYGNWTLVERRRRLPISDEYAKLLEQ